MSKKKGILHGDRDELGKYLRKLADVMGLRDWDIQLVDDAPSDGGAAASIWVVYGRKRAEVRFTHDWSANTPEQLRYYAVHELVHCHLDGGFEVVNNLELTIGKPLHAVTWNFMKDHIEHATDGIAMAWAETLPVPVKG